MYVIKKLTFYWKVLPTYTVLIWEKNFIGLKKILKDGLFIC